MTNRMNCNLFRAIRYRYLWVMLKYCHVHGWKYLRIDTFGETQTEKHLRELEECKRLIISLESKLEEMQALTNELLADRDPSMKFSEPIPSKTILEE